MQQLSEKVLAGDRRAIAKAITLVENGDTKRFQILTDLRYKENKGHVIGITGSPGAGKSSLVDQLTKEYRRQGLTVGIIAVDPSSPYSGGALLGDRIRMQQHATDPGVFIRSMGTRGNLGGLALTTKEAVRVLMASGKDLVLVETVGVGQSELDIMKVADTTIVVLTPGAGDSIQTIKAGIMEIADVFALNKADLPGAMRLAREVHSMLELSYQGNLWRPPVVETVTISGCGIIELVNAVNEHYVYLIKSGELTEKRIRLSLDETLKNTSKILYEWISQLAVSDKKISGLIKKVKEGTIDPHQASITIAEYIKSNCLAGRDLNEDI